MVARIYEYTSGQRRQLERFYQNIHNKNRSRLLIQRILHHDNKKWLYSAVVIIAHAVATTTGSWTRQQKQTSSWLFFQHYRLTWVQVVLMELMVWSAGFGLAWYTWLSLGYVSRVKIKARQAVDEMDRIVLAPKSKVWVMLSDHHHCDIIGVAMIRPCPLSQQYQQEEAYIQVTALTSQTQLALVQTAIQFARQQDIKVIYTQQQDDFRKNKLDGLF